ncbi:hypothetical protein L833_5058 [Mycobacteroides abscessus MAB_091912_2446]|uniref:LppM domain-containing protein n=1 Tax=Mycobacteroides abscessus MAB_091912_2446 TaxID=1335414 RepID=A0A829M7S5_9MYCO|nr:hypothetical protein L833_5058 [Mycobacteroides abscessus MAB_091912_2446]
MARITAVLLLATLPLLSGCVRVKASMTVTTDDHVSGQLIAVAKPQGKNDKGPQLDRNMSFAEKVQVSEYEENGMVGSRAIFNDLTFSEVPQLAGMNKNAAGFDLTLRRNGDVVVLEGRADLTALGDNSNADVSLAVSFPAISNPPTERCSARTPCSGNSIPVWSAPLPPPPLHRSSTRSFNGAAIFVSIAALLVGALVASMAWLDRDQSPRFTPSSPGVTLTPRFSNTSEVARAS